MGAVSTVDQVVREDLSNLYINIDERETPFLGRLKNGEDLNNVSLFSWALEGFDGRQIVGIPENQDADEFETDKQDRLYGRSQKFWRRPHVTVEANTINRAPADFGKYNKQVLKKVTEQKRDIEQRYLGDLDSRDDDGVTGREVMGVGRFVNDATSVGVSGAALTFGDTQTAVPVQYRTPSAQIYVAALYVTSSGVVSDLTFNDDSLNGMLQNRWDALGMSGQLVGFVDAALKRHLGRVFRYAKNLSNYTPLVRLPGQSVTSGDTTIGNIDSISTDFGQLSVEMINWLPRTSTGALSGRGYFLDMQYIYNRPSGLNLTHQQLEDKGAGPRGLIQSIMGPQWGDPRGHLKIDPNAISTGT